MFSLYIQFGEATKSKQEWEGEAHLQTLNNLPLQKIIIILHLLNCILHIPS